MANRNDDPCVCPHCDAEVQVDNDFCAACGELLDENGLCNEHPETLAIGVCVICAIPVCSDCGGRIQNRFLCNRHDTLEIYEGMVRVYGSSDSVQVDFAKSSPEAAGFHPFVFSRTVGPISLDGLDYNAV